MFYRQVHTHVRASPSGSTMQARFPFHAFTGFVFFSVFSCLFSSSFLKSFFSLLSMLEVPKRAPLDPLLGPKMAPKSLQSGLEDVWHGQSECLQIPSVLQYFWLSGGSQDGSKSCSRRFCSLRHVCRFSHRF